MKSSLQVGTKGTLTTKVGPGQTITLGSGLGDEKRATVFSTPSMIHLMEHAAREALRPHLEPGEESVGVDVHITHSSATPPKSEVAADASVTAIEKNVISFDVVARDPWGEIGRGTHRRAVIQTSKFAERLAAKKQPVAASATGSLDGLRGIECKQAGTLLWITLNRPNKRNAFTAEMTTELEQVVGWLEDHHPQVRVVIVRGAGDTFCTGDDVGDLPDAPHEARELSVRRGNVYRRITELPQVVIGAIDGMVLGGGFVFAASCDFRIATHRAEFALPEVVLGWPPNYGMGIVQSLIGRGAALELALSGRKIDARRAESIGLVNRVVSPAQLDQEVTRLAEQLASAPPQAQSAVKRLLAPGKKWCDERASEEFVQCLSSDAAKQSIKRFR